MLKPALTLFLLFALCTSLTAEERPNILWFVVDDMSANFGCYGETQVATPHVDALAEESYVFRDVYATSSVCSTFRSALITGMYQTSIGAHHHRSGQGTRRISLPEGVTILPELFQSADYFTCMGSGLKDFDFRSRPTKHSRLGKSDYNFDWDKIAYDATDWSQRPAEQPFFMQVQLAGGKLRGSTEKGYEAMARQASEILGKTTDRTTVTLPPHYPDDALFRRDYACYLDSVAVTDWHVGQVIARLKDEGLLENTWIFFFTDHGISSARGKQFLYDEGVHIPLIVRPPGGLAQSTTRPGLVEHIDIAATSLAAAGIPLPEKMQAVDILDEKFRGRDFVFAARDRCGETVDKIRSVRNDEYLYIRNFYPERPMLQPTAYKDEKAILIRLRELRDSGKLSDELLDLYFPDQRPAEELYRYEDDEWQLTDLADQPAMAEQLEVFRKELAEWSERTTDAGTESFSVYQQEMEYQLGAIPKSREERRRLVTETIDKTFRWYREREAKD